MQSIKSGIFNYLTKVQKSNICTFIAGFVKKNLEKSSEDISKKFIEDQKYYLEINSSRFDWIAEFIDNEEFLKDLELYIKDCQRKYKYKETQKPLYEKQKAYLKEQRRQIKENKMSKEPPTKAQLYYYKKLCEKYSIENKIDEKNASRLDFRNAIDEVLKNFS